MTNQRSSTNATAPRESRSVVLRSERCGSSYQNTKNKDVTRRQWTRRMRGRRGARLRLFRSAHHSGMKLIVMVKQQRVTADLKILTDAVSFATSLLNSAFSSLQMEPALCRIVSCSSVACTLTTSAPSMAPSRGRRGLLCSPPAHCPSAPWFSVGGWHKCGGIARCNRFEVRLSFHQRTRYKVAASASFTFWSAPCPNADVAAREKSTCL